MKSICCITFLLITIQYLNNGAIAMQPHPEPQVKVLLMDDIAGGKLDGWHVSGAPAAIGNINGTAVLQTQGDSQILWGTASEASKAHRDVTVDADVSVERDYMASGILVRAGMQNNAGKPGGYWACIRRLGPDNAIVQLFRLADFALLQEARVRGSVNLNQLVHLKITCKSTSLWIWANDMSVPAITEFDDRCGEPGLIGLKAENNRASFANILVTSVGATPRASVVRDWSWVKGAVFITSESVNSYQMWEEYHPEVIDRELGYAHTSGINTVQLYLNFLMWQKYRQLYLDRIEDFLKRAERHSLKVTFIFFDDVGSVEPPHLAPYAAPIPGVHNSRMQGSPGRDIVDNHYLEFKESLKGYVKAIVAAHKSDPRIVLWQTYNEPSHASTLPLLADSYRWIKETGSAIPVSATGGGAFYGSYYSDFPTFHSYLDPKAPLEQSMVLADGGPEHLCTETLDRPSVTVPKLVNYFSARKTGWVIWELMIGRDNCRFPWGSPENSPEPTTPFHGLIYPDGHPWSLDDVKAIRSGSG